MIQCANGHFYNQQTHGNCPHCQEQGNRGKTIGLSPHMPKPSPWKKTDIEQVKPQQIQPSILDQIKREQSFNSSDEGKTVGVYMKKEGTEPVVGWLVCIAGKDRGRDYRIHPEKNTLGRSETNDIHIANDQTISRDNHATVIYDPKKRNFRLLAGQGRGLVYVNDEVIDFSTPLKSRDIIELGETKLMFVPLCDEHFDWNS
ncbi:FHA domain-containing protein [Bacillus timonensis]|nr:FHA domain-containing protein [Bacillus timonensis]